MKKLLLCLGLGLVVTTPAHATGGLVCTTAGPAPIQVLVVIGHTAVASVVSVRLSDAGLKVPVTIAQSWVDPSEFRLDLVDPKALHHELRLRTSLKGSAYDGSLWRNGKRHWVRCREG